MSVGPGERVGPHFRPLQANADLSPFLLRLSTGPPGRFLSSFATKWSGPSDLEPMTRLGSEMPIPPAPFLLGG